MGSNVSSRIKFHWYEEGKLRLYPVIMTKEEVDVTLKDSMHWPGTYVIYEDLRREKIALAVKCGDDQVKHYTIVIINDLYYLKSFPFPYLESIVLYYQKHKLNGIKLTSQADWTSQMKSRRSTRISQHLMSTFLASRNGKVSARDKLLFKSKSLRL